MPLPSHLAWPVSLHAAHAVEEFAQQLDGWRAAYSGIPPREWSRVPHTQKGIYRDLATRLLHRLGPPTQGPDDDRLRRADIAIARSLELVLR